jgi:hypothetical protein
MASARHTNAAGKTDFRGIGKKRSSIRLYRDLAAAQVFQEPALP